MVDLRRRRFLRGDLHAGHAVEPVAVRRPPWSLRPDEAFVRACTRCGDCVRACPPQVLHSGDGGFPVIDFSAAGCSLCGDCRRACTTGAIDRSTGVPAFDWRVAVDATCLTRHGVECRLCGDACDARVLRFVPAQGGIAQLQIQMDACTGCGECVSTCPVNAIRLTEPAG